MGWRERFGGDDERARIAARARALLDAAGPRPSPVGPSSRGGVVEGPTALPPLPSPPIPSPPLPSPPRPSPPAPVPVEVAPVEVVPSATAPPAPAEVELPLPTPPVPRRGGWVPPAPALDALPPVTHLPGRGRYDRSPVDAPDPFASLRVVDPDSDPDRGTDPRAERGSDPASGTRPRGAWRDRVRIDPGRRGLVAVAAVVVVIGSIAGGVVFRGGQSSAVTVAAASGAGPADASTAPVVGGSDPTGRATPGADTTSSPSSSPSGTVTVDVAGLVVHPGVYTLPAGSRVEDALREAGGAAPGADLSTLNRARVLVDGEQLAVGVPGAGTSSDPNGGGASGSATGGGTVAGTGGVVDLNTADLSRLDTLPGVGPVLAQAILDWRTDHGRFSSVDDLQQVSGIGPSRFATLKDLVTV